MWGGGGAGGEGKPESVEDRNGSRKSRVGRRDFRVSASQPSATGCRPLCWAREGEKQRTMGNRQSSGVGWGAGNA